MMRVEQMKVDKVKQDRQLLEWKRDNYREMTSLLKAFKDEYFDVLKPSTNFRSSSAFASYNVSSSNTEIATVVAKAGAMSKTHSLIVKQLAAAAKIEGTTSVAKAVKGSLEVSDLTLLGKQININLDGVTKTIALEDYTDISDLKTKLQASINTAFGTGKLDVVLDGNKIEFVSLLNGSTFSISEGANSFISALGFASGQQNYITGAEVKTSDFSIYTNGTFNIDLNGTVQTIQIDSASSVAELASKLQADIDAKFGPDKIKVEEDGSKLTFTSLTGQAVTMTSGSSNNILGSLGFTSGSKITATSSAEIDLSGNEKGKTFTVSIDGVDTTVEIDRDYNDLDDLVAYLQAQLGGVNVTKDASSNRLVFSGSAGQKIVFKKGPEDSLAKLGFEASDNTSNRISLNKGLKSIETYFSSGVVFDSEANVQFVINGTTINLNKTFAEATINDVMTGINTSSAGVEMKYDSLNGRFILTSKKTGVAEDITFTDTHETNGLFKALGIAGGTKTAGQDAVFDLDGVTDMKRGSNEFTVDNVVYTLKQAAPGTTVSIGVNADAGGLVEKIKNFVKKYNEMISKLTSETAEKRDRDYLPLTDEEKEAMSESDIKSWEEKAKTGLLRSDSIINNITSSMRKALMDSVSGVASSLYRIGITTGTYEMKGQLVINEDKLKAAIQDNPDAVAQLFTKESEYSYEEAMNDTGKKAARYAESGLAQRLYDIIQDNIRTTRDGNGKKGILLEKAGIQGDLTEVNNLMNDAIEDKDTLIDKLLEKLVDKENSLYLRFTAMEKALSQLNSQSSWLTQQFGGNTQ
jgi:flagellar hook-associated protein 2